MLRTIIGLDLGTTTVTGVLLDADSGDVLRLAQRRNDAAIPKALSTRAEQDPLRLRSLALDALAELASGEFRRLDRAQEHDLRLAAAGQCQEG